MNFFEYSLDDFHAVCFWESLAGGLWSIVIDMNFK